ncbi:2-oxoacid:acceptor oxidoreductase family protein [Ruminococcus flavefaciens]|uniref:2-oxoacid:acceptor oxidoreductase family protein n=1 Tax=Ruminococcus flavefaciens TaxID=1265 RepID=UPI0026EED585|nr:2-oxoacid:acceptor oxidoreductase family protein [Ruminococcus flavefaciens]
MASTINTTVSTDNALKEIIWLGRGGQGAFTAAKLLGAAYTIDSDDKYALAFPSFGPERRGAPVRAFTKLDTRPVVDRSQTEKADYIVILDDTLYSPQLLELLKADGKIIVNSKNDISGVCTFDAEKIASEFRLPTVNTVMLGLLTGISDIVSTENAAEAIRNYMPQKIQERNINALLRSVQEVIK